MGVDGGINGKEHRDLMAQFEREYKGLRFDRENTSLWAKGNIYASGETNNIFLAYRKGFVLGKSQLI